MFYEGIYTVHHAEFDELVNLEFGEGNRGVNKKWMKGYLLKEHTYIYTP